VATASSGPHANHLHLAPDRQPQLITQFFTDRMLFLVKALTANQAVFTSHSQLQKKNYTLK